MQNESIDVLKSTKERIFTVRKVVVCRGHAVQEYERAVAVQ